ncbi:MAG: type II secretion system minor pseudopilin GspK [Gammaproteobacteria bacterium]|nr:type II secretion system minor pseudopilin GspK [Gammaproteobacteria bacterium]
MRMPCFPQRQRGAALIIAMVIVAIAVILTTQLTWKTHLEQRRVENQLYGGQAIAYAIGAEDWAREILIRDDAAVDHLGEDWAAQDARFPIEGGTLIGSISDLQGRFNLNNLYDESLPADDPEAVREPIKQALADLFALEGNVGDAAIAAQDWQDRDIDPAGIGGAEDSAYSREVPPYLAPNTEFFSPSELQSVAGMTPEAWQALRAHVAALPADATRVNINTATAPVILALGQNLTETDVQAILQYREQGGIEELNELESLLGPDKSLPAERFGVTSSWFLLTVRAEIGSSAVTMYSLLHRDADTVRTVARTLGTW